MKREFPKHRDFIRSLPCCVTGMQCPSDPAHIRLGTDGGMGLKPHDMYIVPLSRSEHSLQHNIGEQRYWGGNLDLARRLANDLWIASGDRDKANILLARFVYAISFE